MSVKITRRLTRQEAEKQYADIRVAVRTERRRAKLSGRTRSMRRDELPWAGRHLEELGELPMAALIEAYMLVDIATHEPEWRNEARLRVVGLSDTRLEDELDRLEDETHDGDGLYDYLVVPAVEE